MYFLPFVSINPVRIALLIQPPRKRRRPPETVTKEGSLIAPKCSSPLGTRHLVVSIDVPLNSSLQFKEYPDGGAAVATLRTPCRAKRAAAESSQHAVFVRRFLARVFSFIYAECLWFA